MSALRAACFLALVLARVHVGSRAHDICDALGNERPDATEHVIGNHRSSTTGASHAVASVPDANGFAVAFIDVSGRVSVQFLDQNGRNNGSAVQVSPLNQVGSACTNPEIAFNAVSKELLVLWEQPRPTEPQLFDIWGRRVDGLTHEFRGSAKHIEIQTNLLPNSPSSHPQLVHDPAANHWVIALTRAESIFANSDGSDVILWELDFDLSWLSYKIFGVKSGLSLRQPDIAFNCLSPYGFYVVIEMLNHTSSSSSIIGFSLPDAITPDFQIQPVLIGQINSDDEIRDHSPRVQFVSRHNEYVVIFERERPSDNLSHVVLHHVSHIGSLWMPALTLVEFNQSITPGEPSAVYNPVDDELALSIETEVSPGRSAITVIGTDGKTHSQSFAVDISPASNAQRSPEIVWNPMLNDYLAVWDHDVSTKRRDRGRRVAENLDAPLIYQRSATISAGPMSVLQMQQEDRTNRKSLVQSRQGPATTATTSDVSTTNFATTGSVSAATSGVTMQVVTTAVSETSGVASPATTGMPATTAVSDTSGVAPPAATTGMPAATSAMTLSSTTRYSAVTTGAPPSSTTAWSSGGTTGVVVAPQTTGVGPVPETDELHARVLCSHASASGAPTPLSPVPWYQTCEGLFVPRPPTVPPPFNRAVTAGSGSGSGIDAWTVVLILFSIFVGLSLIVGATYLYRRFQLAKTQFADALARREELHDISQSDA